MKKIKLKNSFDNSLISYLKENKIKFSRKSIQHLGLSTREELIFKSTNRKVIKKLNSLLNNEFLYHNTSLQWDFKIKNYFNYNSNQFENVSSINSELELPCFYIENVNEDNKKHAGLKALSSKRISKDYILKISDLQEFIPFKNSFEKRKMSNILFCNDYNLKRNKEEKSNIPYYNRFTISTENTTNLFGDFLKKIKFQEEFIGCLETFSEEQTVNFMIDENVDPTPVQVTDLFKTISDGNPMLSLNNKIVFSKIKNNSNTMNNSFKKFITNNFLGNKTHLLKNLNKILANEECEKEVLIYKVEKFFDTDGAPFQSFWMFEEPFNEFLDMQIKRDKVYRYEFKPYLLVYGTFVNISNVISADDTIRALATYSPSYKLVQLTLEEEFMKTSSFLQLPPYVRFINESNSENYVKIYLDLKKGSYKDFVEQIAPNDNQKLNFIEYDNEGKARFEYFTQKGVFEVFRSDQKPETIYSFENKKIINVENKYYSTSVVFKDKILPNKKYYYMFRSLNVTQTPSNPTKIYEVELIKDSNNSKINVKTIDLKKHFVLKDKKMKRLLQIKPCFDQRVFDDEDDLVKELNSFKKNVEKLSLGVSPDKVWGKKFKIRIKSKDTGKIIDLNIKFNVVKDNII